MEAVAYLGAPLIIGTGGDDVLRAETSVTLAWVPDAGSAFTRRDSYSDWMSGDTWTSATESPSAATGTMTFHGVSSGEPFEAVLLGADFRFSFTDGSWFEHASEYGTWVWDPLAEGFSSGAGFHAWDNWIGFFLEPNAVTRAYSRSSSYGEAIERGHWKLVGSPQDTEIRGGAGDDTIYGGQGEQTLSGGAGNDAIWLGRGGGVGLGGAGRDVIRGGVGAQTLDGGAGDDVLRGGRGAQLLKGGGGNDELRAGTGEQVLRGGAGADTIWGGLGTQSLFGDGGNDTLHAGPGLHALYGGAGRDTFVFHGVGQARIEDFRAGQDRIELDLAPDATLRELADVAAHLLSDAEGNAVLDLGSGATLTLLGVAEDRAKAHTQDWFALAAS